MVVEFGLSPALGPVSYSSDGPQYLGAGQVSGANRPDSEETQRIVDQQVALLLRNAEQTALELLRSHRAALDRLAELLLTHETVDGSVVLQTLRETTNQPPLQPAARE